MKNLILPEQMNAPVLCALFKWKYRFNAIECVSMHFIFFGIFSLMNGKCCLSIIDRMFNLQRHTVNHLCVYVNGTHYKWYAWSKINGYIKNYNRQQFKFNKCLTHQILLIPNVLILCFKHWLVVCILHFFVWNCEKLLNFIFIKFDQITFKCCFS